MIQGGDPTNTGKGGTSIWGKKFNDEIRESLKVTSARSSFVKFLVHSPLDTCKNICINEMRSYNLLILFSIVCSVKADYL